MQHWGNMREKLYLCRFDLSQKNKLWQSEPIYFCESLCSKEQSKIRMQSSAVLQGIISSNSLFKIKLDVCHQRFFLAHTSKGHECIEGTFGFISGRWFWQICKCRYWRIDRSGLMNFVLARIHSKRCKISLSNFQKRFVSKQMQNLFCSENRQVPLHFFSGHHLAVLTGPVNYSTSLKSKFLLGDWSQSKSSRRKMGFIEKGAEWERRECIYDRGAGPESNYSVAGVDISWLTTI